MKNKTEEIIEDLMFQMRQDGIIKKMSVRQLATFLGFSHTQIYNMMKDDSLTISFLRELNSKYGKYKVKYQYIKKNIIYKD